MKDDVGDEFLSLEAVARSKHLLQSGQRLPMLGKLLSFSGKSSL